MRRLTPQALALLALFGPHPVQALDIRSSAVAGRGSPAGNPLCADPKNIEFNRADRTLTICDPSGNPSVNTLLKALPAGRRAVEQGQSDDQTVAGVPLSSVIQRSGGKTTLTSDAITGDASGASATPAGETVSRTLQQLVSDLRSAESFGAVGDGIANDTAAFAKLSTWMGAAKGRGVVGRTGAVYLVDNWIWPYQEENSFSCPGPCTVKARNGGDADFLASTYRYPNNIGYMYFPIRVTNVTFDAAGIKSKAFVAQTYFSQFTQSYAINSTQDGWVLPVNTRNGAALVGTVGPENTWINSGAYGNARHGLYNEKYTDGQIRGGQWYDNGGPSGAAGYEIYLGQTAGWGLQGVHTYGKGGQSNLDLYAAQVGFGSIIANNLFEGIVTVASVENTNNHGMIGPNNSFWGGLNAVIGNGGATVLTSFGNSYKFATGVIRHQYNFADHVVRSVNDTFDTATPFAWSSGNTGGVIRAENAYSKALDARINGEYTGNDTVLPAEFKLSKSLANATTTTITASVVVSKDLSQSPFELTVDLFGSEVSGGFGTLDAFSAQVTTVGAREYQSALAGAKALVTRSVSSNVGITFAAATAITGGTGDQTFTTTITITHPTPSFSPGFPMDIKARVKGKGVKAVTLN